MKNADGSSKANAIAGSKRKYDDIAQNDNDENDSLSSSSEESDEEEDSVDQQQATPLQETPVSDSCKEEGSDMVLLA